MSAAAAAPAPAPAVRDIRDPTRVVKYNLTRKVDDIGYDWLGAVSMILSMGGSYLKNPFCAWGALFACFASMFLGRSQDFDYKQFLGSFMLAFMGIVMTYAVPSVAKTAAATAAVGS